MVEDVTFPQIDQIRVGVRLVRRRVDAEADRRPDSRS